MARKAGKVRKMKELEVERNGLKSEIKMAENNYTELKTKLGYESPACLHHCLVRMRMAIVIDEGSKLSRQQQAREQEVKKSTSGDKVYLINL